MGGETVQMGFPQNGQYFISVAPSCIFPVSILMST